MFIVNRSNIRTCVCTIIIIINVVVYIFLNTGLCMCMCVCTPQIILREGYIKFILRTRTRRLIFDDYRRPSIQFTLYIRIFLKKQKKSFKITSNTCVTCYEQQTKEKITNNIKKRLALICIVDILNLNV